MNYSKGPGLAMMCYIVNKYISRGFVTLRNLIDGHFQSGFIIMRHIHVVLLTLPHMHVIWLAFIDILIYLTRPDPRRRSARCCCPPPSRCPSSSTWRRACNSDRSTSSSLKRREANISMPHQIVQILFDKN